MLLLLLLLLLLLKSCFSKNWETLLYLYKYKIWLLFREFPGAGASARFALSAIT
jgi:hypothetical protein